MSDREQTELERAIPESVIHLLSFMVSTWVEMSEIRGKAILPDCEDPKELLKMKWPMIQGLGNHIRLKEFARNFEADGKECAKALEWIAERFRKDVE